MEEAYPWQCHECHRPFKKDDVTDNPPKPRFARDKYVYCRRCSFPRSSNCGNSNRTLPDPNPWDENAVRALEGD